MPTTAEELQVLYKEVYGTDVSNRYKNNVEWMTNKIQAAQLTQLETEEIQQEEEKQEEVSSENVEPEAGEVVAEETPVEEENISIMKHADKIQEQMDAVYTETIAPIEQAERDSLDTFVKVQKFYGFSTADINNTKKLKEYYKLSENHLALVEDYAISTTPKQDNPIITKRGTRDYIRPLKEKYGLNSQDFFDEEKLREKIFADLPNHKDQAEAKAIKEKEVQAVLTYAKASR